MLTNRDKMFSDREKEDSQAKQKEYANQVFNVLIEDIENGNVDKISFNAEDFHLTSWKSIEWKVTRNDT